MRHGLDRMTILSIASLAGAIGIACVSAMQMAVDTPELTAEARFYVSLVGALAGWTVMGLAILTQLYSKREHPPLFSTLVFSVGVSQVMIFNEFLITNDAVSITFKALGYITLISSVFGIVLYRHGLHVASQRNAE